MSTLRNFLVQIFRQAPLAEPYVIVFMTLARPTLQNSFPLFALGDLLP